MVKLKEIEAADDAGDLYRLQTEWWRDRGLRRPELIGALPKIMRYIERLEEQAKPITWTSTKPTTPGWYWWRSLNIGIHQRCTEVYQDSSGKLFCIYGLNNGEWSSEPIAEPQEAT